jgi:DNA-binding LacI/PurR family transcriptional regulator
MSTRRSRRGVVIPDIVDPFFTAMVRGIEDALQPEDYTLLLGDSDGRAERERLYLDTLRAEGVAGILFVPFGNASSAAYSRSRLALTLAHVAEDAHALGRGRGIARSGEECRREGCPIPRPRRGP